MTRHVQVVAVLFMVFGAFSLAGALFSSVLFGSLAHLVGASHEEGAALGVAVLNLTGFALTILLLCYGVPAILCGWGLLKFRRWARILGIILGALSLVKFPIGTFFGVYVLWVLFSRRTEPLFDNPPAA